MTELVADCPRCGAKSITFDMSAVVFLRETSGWQCSYEAFSVCRHCTRSTVFLLRQKGGGDPHEFRGKSPVQMNAVVNTRFEVTGFVSLKDRFTSAPPEHVRADIANAFKEAATCMSVECWNAAGAMFRMCVDLATRAMLPEAEVAELNAKVRRDLGLRLRWLLEQGRLPKDLADLSGCIREDGNDGAHAGTLTKADAEDLLDFAEALLERLYTEPRRLELANERRKARREPTA
jgi:hypothetical protein